MNKPATREGKHRRHFGKHSPLDRLAPMVRDELRKRCLRGDLFREIQQWLRATHRCAISISSLSEWNIRRNEEASLTPLNGGQQVARFCSGSCEIIITAPGAQSLTVRMRPLTSAES